MITTHPLSVLSVLDKFGRTETLKNFPTSQKGIYKHMTNAVGNEPELLPTIFQTTRGCTNFVGTTCDKKKGQSETQFDCKTYAGV